MFRQSFRPPPHRSTIFAHRHNPAAKTSMDGYAYASIKAAQTIHEYQMIAINAQISNTGRIQYVILAPQTLQLAHQQQRRTRDVGRRNRCPRKVPSCEMNAIIIPRKPQKSTNRKHAKNFHLEHLQPAGSQNAPPRSLATEHHLPHIATYRLRIAYAVIQHINIRHVYNIPPRTVQFATRNSVSVDCKQTRRPRARRFLVAATWTQARCDTHDNMPYHVCIASWDRANPIKWP